MVVDIGLLVENGGPGRICTANLPIQSRLLYGLSYGANKTGTRTPDLHRVDRFCRPTIRLFILCAMENWVDQRDLHPHGRLHRAGCYSYNMVNIGKWCSREDLPFDGLRALSERCASKRHLELPPSQDGVHDSYTSGAGKNGTPCRCCPGFCGVKGRYAS